MEGDEVLQGDTALEAEEVLQGEDALEDEDLLQGDDALEGEDLLQGDDALEGDEVLQGEDAVEGKEVSQGEDALESEPQLGTIREEEDPQNAVPVQDVEACFLFTIRALGLSCLSPLLERSCSRRQCQVRSRVQCHRRSARPGRNGRRQHLQRGVMFLIWRRRLERLRCGDFPHHVDTWVTQMRRKRRNR